jgi:carbon-monoxide dehydrogenase small subunit
MWALHSFVNGKAILSCIMLASHAAGKKIETAESLSADKITLDPIAKAFRDGWAFQCGFCTPGFMMSTKALLTENSKPTIAEIQQGLSGNLCICSCYKSVFEAVQKLAGG